MRKEAARGHEVKLKRRARGVVPAAEDSHERAILQRKLKDLLEKD